jgi:hypothetical protein
VEDAIVTAPVPNTSNEAAGDGIGGGEGAGSDDAFEVGRLADVDADGEVRRAVPALDPQATAIKRNDAIATARFMGFTCCNGRALFGL